MDKCWSLVAVETPSRAPLNDAESARRIALELMHSLVDPLGSSELIDRWSLYF
jgi:hypothetical protein